jgi:ABC-type multidrug transport system ATPase subunit
MTTAAAAVALPDDSDDSDATTATTESTDVAELHDVTLGMPSYGVSLYDVSLRVPRDAVTVVVSPRDGAAGTVVDLLLGRGRPRWGEVHRGAEVAEVRRFVGLPRGRTVRETLIELRHDAGLDADPAWVGLLARTLGLREAEGARGPREVDAQRVRWGIARALVAQPDLVVVDDLTGGYLRAAGEGVLEQLTVLARQGATAVLVATGDPAVAEAVDHAVVLERGRVVEASR